MWCGSQALLTALNLTYLIARDVDEYVSIALEGGRNATLRQETKEAIRSRIGALTTDTTSVRAWAKFLEDRVRGDASAFTVMP